MSTKAKKSLKSANSYAPWILSAIAIIAFFKVALSPEEIELIILLKRLVVAVLVVVPTVYLFLFLGFYFDLIDENKPSE